MKNINFNRQLLRQARHDRILKRIRNGSDLLRLLIKKTNSHFYMFVIDDQQHKTLTSSSTVHLKLPNGNFENTRKVAADLLVKLKNNKIEQLALDRGPHKYHGKIKEVATFLRNEGIKI